MNRIRYSAICLICADNMQARMDRTEPIAERAELMRQILNGICDPCQRLRFAAALEYQAAKDELAVMILLGAGTPRHRQGETMPFAHPAYKQADLRLKYANQECVRLRMWPATERSTR